MKLKLVKPGGYYRAAPDLSRPELRDAFEQGRADRRTNPPNEVLKSRMDLMKASGPEVRRAYLRGRRGGHAVAPPGPLALALPALGASIWLTFALERRTGSRRLPALIALVLVTLVSDWGLMRIGQRRAQALGLNVETAPERYTSPTALVLPAMSIVQALSYRIRHGNWRADPTTTAAALIVHELMSRRSWRAITGSTQPAWHETAGSDPA